MDARRRRQNERKFGTWTELPSGGRRYSFEVKGRSGWSARYVKEVDADASTVRFYQEVFDGDGQLREGPGKFPADLGRRKVTGEESLSRALSSRVAFGTPFSTAQAVRLWS